jgi:hypothetical protein
LLKCGMLHVLIGTINCRDGDNLLILLGRTR